jgi:hypothetical protein
MVATLVKTIVKVQPCPVVTPRIEGIMKTFGEIAHNQQVPRHHIEILYKALDFGVIDQCTVETWRADGTTPYVVEKKLDLKAHKELLETDSSGFEIKNPYDPLSTQIDRRFGDLLAYLYAIKNSYGVVRTGLRFRYVPTIGNDALQYDFWNQKLGLVTAAPINWAAGAQREYAFRPPAMSECTFVLRRVTG